MKIYLAARYSRREELCGYRARLEALGHTVTSRWLNGAHQISDEGTPIGDHGEALVESGNGRDAATLRTRFAEEDVADVYAADVFVAFTEQPRTGGGRNRGGRHVELGLALGRSKKCVVIGPRENLFCWLPAIDHFGTFDDFVAACGRRGKGSKSGVPWGFRYAGRRLLCQVDNHGELS